MIFGRLKKLGSRNKGEKKESGLGKAVGALDDRSKQMLMILSMVLIVVLTFVLANRIFGDRSLELMSDNTRLMNLKNEYQELINDQEDIISQTDELNADTNEILDGFGAGNTPEKTLVFLDKLCAVSGMSIPAVDFGQETLVDTSGADDSGLSEEAENVTDSVMADTVAGQDQIDDLEGNTDSASADAEQASGGSTDSMSAETTEHYLYVYTVTFSYSVPYAGLKTALEYIANYSERMSVAGYTSSWNETSQTVTGSITLNMYTLTGTEKSYLTPAMSGVALGKGNIYV